MKYGLKIGDPVYWVVNGYNRKVEGQYRCRVVGFGDKKVMIEYQLDGDVFPRKRYVGAAFLFLNEKKGLQTLGLK